MHENGQVVDLLQDDELPVLYFILYMKSSKLYMKGSHCPWRFTFYIDAHGHDTSIP
jgi:hypothetical protein